MLLFLTGDIQIGKTRWLLRQIDALEREGVQVCGVVAPGTWIERAGTFEKTGIDNLLLPERKVVPFARRRDIAQAQGAYDSRSQSSRAKLGWAISDEALAKVDAHLARLARLDEAPCDPDQPAPRRLLVIDELGSLELEHAGGLTSALALLDRGATPAFPHALAVVRASLLDTAQARFTHAPWNGIRTITPNEPAASLLKGIS